MWSILPQTHPTTTTNFPPQRKLVHNHSHHRKQLNTVCIMASLGQEQESDDKREDNKQLSGADVLVALQKANAKKVMKKKEVKLVSRTSNNGKKRGNQDGITSLTDVKPLEIKQEWSERLGDLETRLEEFMHG